ncbi:hypothetical protein N9878_02760, partial [bacterium]|nr:hypothetical protein [bacterium]
MEKELAEQSSAKEIVGHLLLSCGVAWLLGKMLSFPFQGFAFGLGAILYLVYLGYKMAYLKAKSIRDLRVVAEDRQTDWKEKQTQLQNFQLAIKRKADELKQEANAIKDKATALESIANDNATL